MNISLRKGLEQKTPLLEARTTVGSVLKWLEREGAAVLAIVFFLLGRLFLLDTLAGMIGSAGTG